ncbi:MAG: hypothetical protein AAGF98_11635 [Cyanobacteria bacterium P01_H01_bin.153]
MNLFFPYLIFPILLMTFFGVLLFYRQRNGQQAISLRRSLWHFKVNLILLAVCATIATVTVYILTATLDDAGYPNVPEDVQTAEQVLNYLQQYNRAIRTNTYALLWFFYGLTVWFLTTLYAFAQAIVHTLLVRSQ